ncbi:LysR family transcriptional regulator [Thiohalorhabdus methylotrophus]|uniref:LysR family transcriptional regulator n=1 Tax=Thiohalorhabdus methylotrophus TaxID=3242694 RepID=A0ABV4TQC5_9GAMM
MEWQRRVPPIRGLMALRAVSEAGTFTGAARYLGWNQPNVSKHLQALETALDAKLLHREHSGNKLTEAGERVLEHATAITDSYAALVRELERMRAAETGRLRIAASLTIGDHWLPQVLMQFGEMHPHIAVESRVLYGREGLRQAAQGLADVALVEGDPGESGLTAQKVGEDMLMVACGQDHPWAAKGSLTLEEFTQGRYILRERGSGTRDTLDHYLEEANLPPMQPELEVGSNHAILQMLKNGEHLTVLSSLTLQDAQHSGFLVLLPVRGLNLKRAFWAVRAPQARSLPAADTFIDFLRNNPPNQELTPATGPTETAQPT